MEKALLERWYWGTLDGGVARGGVFGRYYDHLQRALLWCMDEMGCARGAAVPELTGELMEAYLGQMKRITLRALLMEMEICEEEGSLKGFTGEEKYACFEEDFLGNPDYLREVYDAYPLMYEGVLRTMGDFGRNIGEALERFAEDREGINSRFFQGNPCRKIWRIGGGGSDAHRHGRRVLILEADNGEKLVYKPRSLAIDEKYTAFLGWVFRGMGMPFWWNCAWDRGSYGWCQWVSGSACHSREELERYYYRNGILLCVSYLLGSEDIHYENLIACGEYPVIVDLEMIVGSRGMGQDREMGNTERFYRESVLQAGLLPLYTWNRDGEGINVSAINGKGGQLAPVKVPVVAEPGTINMHIEYRRPATREGKTDGTKREMGKRYLWEAGAMGVISDRWGTGKQEAEGIRIRIAERIGDILLENAIWSEDGREAGWLSMMTAGFRADLRRLGTAVYAERAMCCGCCA